MLAAVAPRPCHYPAAKRATEANVARRSAAFPARRLRIGLCSADRASGHAEGSWGIVSRRSRLISPSCLTGLVFGVTPGDLARLDAYEGVGHGWCRRVRVTTGEGDEV